MGNKLSGPITHWLAAARAGEGEPEEDLFEEFRRVLVPVARGKLGRRRSHYEAEDVVQSFLRQLAGSVRRDGWPGVADREELWAFLYESLTRKIVDFGRRDGRAKRGGGWARKPIGPCDVADDASAGAAECVDLADLVDRLMAILPTDADRAVARLILVDGLPYDDVALALGCAPATVHRRRKRIQQIWKDYLGPTTATD